MSYVNLEEHLDRIVGHDGKEREAVNVRLALTDYPGIVGFKHNTGEILLTSTEINVFCTDVLIEREGDALVALPFTESKGTRLHSFPTVFYLGLENTNGFGIVPFTDWDEHLQTAEIDQKVIRKIRSFLNAHQPANYL
jgi:hypothetical protein